MNKYEIKATALVDKVMTEWGFEPYAETATEEDLMNGLIEALCRAIKQNDQLQRDHAAAVKEANIAKARLKGVEKQWHADRAALQELSK
jgi:hypothetical protein